MEAAASDGVRAMRGTVTGSFFANSYAAAFSPAGSIGEVETRKASDNLSAASTRGT